MINTVQDFAINLWRSGKKIKSTPSGWQSGNAPCCVHNGETVDTRGRGGFHSDPNGNISYSCFNCGYTASYQPGRHLTYKFRKLLSWMGADDSDIRRLVIEAIRIKELAGSEENQEKDSNPITFTPRPLPENCLSFDEVRTFLSLIDENYNIKENLPNIEHKLDYVKNRFIDLDKYNFYITESTEHSLHQRVIIPYIWQGETIGYSARAVVEAVRPKYYSNHEPNFVFNVDQQKPNWKFVIVCEGPFDAMSVDGVAILGNECSEQQAEIIDSLGREVIVVPDNDKAGDKLISNAIEYGWSVSYPTFFDTCKDINDSVVKYGKLFTLKSILAGKQSSKLKIELYRRRIR